MTQDEIIEMAEEAGAIHYWHLSNLERFAALVASAEREECANVAEQVGQHKNQHGIAAAIRARGQA